MIVTMARKWPQQDHAPATADHDAEKPARRTGGRHLRKSLQVVVKPSIAPMSSTTQQQQHSLNRRRKSMPFIGVINIKVIYFLVGHVSDIGLGELGCDG